MPARQHPAPGASLTRICATLGACAALVSSAFGDLPALLQEFDARRIELVANRDRKLDALKENYLSALDRHLKATQRTGHLDQVLPIRDEINAVREGPLAELGEAARRDARLVELRRTYETARNKINDEHKTAATTLAAQTEARVDEEIANLTRAGRLDQAVAARELRAKVRTMLELDGDAQDQADPAPAGKLPRKDAAGFRDLLQFPFTVTEGGSHYTGPLEGEGGKGARNPPVVQWLETQHSNLREVMQMGHGSQVVFRSAVPLTSFKGTAILSGGGDTVFRVKARGTTVLEERLNDDLGTRRELTCTFQPTERLVLELEARDPSKAAAWIAPRVR